ncbi:MAG: TolC family protein [Verrucomicrobia bacterium]|nr:TolC family protein [Verrucomicrobiota bacterium]
MSARSRVSGWLLHYAALLLWLGFSLASQGATNKPLLLPEVLTSVKKQYPPFLAALIDQDIAKGRIRQALGSFDLNLNSGGAKSLAGPNDGAAGYAILDQPFPFWGGNVYGGYTSYADYYLLSSGYLPNYNKNNSLGNSEGVGLVGLRIPLLKDGVIDERRAKLWQAKIDQELADPVILRQYLDFIRAATISYYTWLASGHRLALTEELLRIAQVRDSAIAEQVKLGAAAPIVQVNNQQMVVSREIALVVAKRRFQASAIELSLFYRTLESAQPIIAGRERLPKQFPPQNQLENSRMNADLAKAVFQRPEMRRIELLLKKADIDHRLAKNSLLPNLDVGLLAAQPAFYGQTELEGLVQLKMPLQQREAEGRVDVADSTISRLNLEKRFTQDRIVADVRDSFVAVDAAYNALGKTRRNVDLARQLQTAEQERLKLGATDLLNLQIREQFTFDAEVLEVEAQADYFRAQANYDAAVAADAPTTFAK